MTKMGYLVRRRYSDDRDETANEWFTEFENKFAGDAEKEPYPRAVWIPFNAGPGALDRKQHRMWANTRMTNMPRVIETLCEAKTLVEAIRHVDFGTKDEQLHMQGYGIWYQVVAVTYEGQSCRPSVIQLEGPVMQSCQ